VLCHRDNEASPSVNKIAATMSSPKPRISRDPAIRDSVHFIELTLPYFVSLLGTRSGFVGSVLRIGGRFRALPVWLPGRLTLHLLALLGHPASPADHQRQDATGEPTDHECEAQR
jgi:hypothetical protein